MSVIKTDGNDTRFRDVDASFRITPKPMFTDSVNLSVKNGQFIVAVVSRMSTGETAVSKTHKIDSLTNWDADWFDAPDFESWVQMQMAHNQWARTFIDRVESGPDNVVSMNRKSVKRLSKALFDAIENEAKEGDFVPHPNPGFDRCDIIDNQIVARFGKHRVAFNIGEEIIDRNDFIIQVNSMFSEIVIKPE